MTMTVGDRIVKGKIKPREEARAIYEAARDAGHVASLLDQERPNIFTQSVTNISPGAEVKITISYVELLSYENGTYEFVFPMVVGPRYIPGSPTGKQGSGWAPDTTQVPDASRITPHVAPPLTRAGHDIAISFSLDAGVPIDSLSSTLHEVDIQRPGDHRAEVRLKHQLVGLFGTVFGIINAFVGMKKAETAGISAVSGGIAEALVTTAVGLAVAVPSVWLFNYFVSKVDNFVVDMNSSSAESINFLLKQRAENKK